MESTFEVSLVEGSYLLPLISRRIGDLKHSMNPVREDEIRFRGVLCEELSMLEEIRQRLISIYAETVRVS